MLSQAHRHRQENIKSGNTVECHRFCFIISSGRDGGEASPGKRLLPKTVWPVAYRCHALKAAEKIRKAIQGQAEEIRRNNSQLLMVEHSVV